MAKARTKNSGFVFKDNQGSKTKAKIHEEIHVKLTHNLRMFSVTNQHKTEV